MKGATMVRNAVVRQWRNSDALEVCCAACGKRLLTVSAPPATPHVQGMFAPGWKRNAVGLYRRRSRNPRCRPLVLEQWKNDPMPVYNYDIPVVRAYEFDFPLAIECDGKILYEDSWTPCKTINTVDAEQIRASQRLLTDAERQARPTA